MTLDDFEFALIDKVENFTKNIVGISDIDFELGNDFCWWSKDNIITVSFMFAEMSENAFHNYCVSLGLDSDLYSSFGVSLLHELGHVKTYYTFNYKQRAEDAKSKDILESAEMDTYKRYMDYYKLPIETAATKWAIDFINSHTKEYIKFCFDIQDLCKECLPNFVTDL